MTEMAKFRKADMNRLFSSARAHGYSEVEGEITPDGKIRFRAVDGPAADGDDDWRKSQPFYRGKK